MNDDKLSLLHRYLDGAITPEELGQLENLLRSSADARATLRSLATIDAKWQQIVADDAIGTPTKRESVSRITKRPIPLWLTLSALAASLIFGAFGWFRTPEQQAAQVERGIARVIRVEGQSSVGKDGIVASGTELYPGDELVMPKGLIELAFRETGVHVIATAPLKLMLDSDQRVSLLEGQVKLVVPPQGVGFVVDTAQRKFVDLGTSFVVSASASGSEVLVLDGEISVSAHHDTPADLMHEGDFARFDQKGDLKSQGQLEDDLTRAIPELSLLSTNPGAGSLQGMILGYDGSNEIENHVPWKDFIARGLSPLIQSGFRDRDCLEAFKQGKQLSFRGIAGAFHQFPEHAGLTPYALEGGWVKWYHGRVVPPRSGRYRFWGYADNHLLVAIDGKPVFEGSRRNSSFKELGIPRSNNPAYPCLVASAGFARSDWIDLEHEPVQLDVMFGEISGNGTTGLLLVEREGEQYEETFWGQPKWPIFLTAKPSVEESAEFERLLNHLEPRIMGAFSVSEEAIWKVADEATPE
ncbi:FecR domain-containing protein [Novipirellula artificiosorum]|nr:FecR domain-containing protein [Novipirellula artificiosorum]